MSNTYIHEYITYMNTYIHTCTNIIMYIYIPSIDPWALCPLVSNVPSLPHLYTLHTYIDKRMCRTYVDKCVLNMIEVFVFKNYFQESALLKFIFIVTTYKNTYSSY